MEIHVKRPSRKQNTNEYQALTENALCARHFYEHFTYINLLHPHNNFRTCLRSQNLQILVPHHLPSLSSGDSESADSNTGKHSNACIENNLAMNTAL